MTAYRGAESSIRRLEAAPVNGWTVVDMKKDWKVIYPFEK